VLVVELLQQAETTAASPALSWLKQLRQQMAARVA
jgi:hypothetical protein